MKRLYFDYNATAPLADGLKEKILTWLDRDPKNPSSVHQDGQAARALIEKSRKDILALLGARPGDRLVFTSGGTEANNTVWQAACARRGERDQVLLTDVEHSSVYNCAMKLAERGIEPLFVKSDRRGRVDRDDFEKKLSDRVFLVSCMLVNNETGFVFPIREMAAAAHRHGIPFHTDAVCATGKWPVNFKDLDVDFLSFSSHKFGGLKGSGGLVFKGNSRLEPLLLGGGHESGLRAGTENVIGIAATAYALKTYLTGLNAELERQRLLRNRLKEGIVSVYGNAVVIESEENLPQTLCVAFAGLSGNLLLTNLDLEGVAASYGSACASGSLEVSRVMKNLGLKFDEARAAIRFSFGPGTTEADVEDFLGRLRRVVERI